MSRPIDDDTWLATIVARHGLKSDEYRVKLDGFGKGHVLRNAQANGPIIQRYSPPPIPGAQGLWYDWARPRFPRGATVAWLGALWLVETDALISVGMAAGEPWLVFQCDDCDTTNTLAGRRVAGLRRLTCAACGATWERK